MHCEVRAGWGWHCARAPTHGLFMAHAPSMHGGRFPGWVTEKPSEQVSQRTCLFSRGESHMYFLKEKH